MKRLKNKLTKSLLFMLAIIVMGMGCGEENIEEILTSNVDIGFDLLDETGEPSTKFQEGLNIHFRFTIRNNFSEDIRYLPDFIDDDFFRVYRIDTSEGILSMGKPYENLFCEFSGSHFIIPSGDERRFEIPWSPSEDFCCPPFCKVNTNEPLPKGKYKTSIEGPFNFTYNEMTFTINDKFEISFEIN